MKGEILFQPVLVKTRVREANVKNVNETKSEEKKKKKKETTCYPLHYNEKILSLITCYTTSKWDKAFSFLHANRSKDSKL